MTEPTASPTPETVEQVKQLLQRIARSEGTDRTAAERELQAMGMEGAYAIRQLLDPSIQTLQKGTKRFLKAVWWLHLGVIISLAFLILGLLYPFHLTVLQKVNTFLLVILFGMVGVLRLMARTRYSPQYEVQALLRVQDKRIIPLLMDIPAKRVATSRTILITLNSLLPTLQAGDAYLLTAEHRNQFNIELGWISRTPLRKKSDTIFVDYFVAVLAALQQVGDYTSLPYVERLAQKAANPRIREAAQECLPFLQERVTSQGQTLLHPASRPEDAVDILVRPATVGENTDAGQLLRAGTADEKTDGG